MNLSKALIYIADDDADDRYFMRQSLQEIHPSVTIVESENGDELLSLLDALSQGPDLILLDMNMPKVNGLEALMAIRENPLLRHTPTVMISTSAEPMEVANAYRLGINGYIRKATTHAYANQIAQAIRVCFLDATVG